MVFNVHITSMAENLASGHKPADAHPRKNTKRPAHKHVPESALVTEPTDHAVSKFPVRIFTIQPQE